MTSSSSLIFSSFIAVLASLSLALVVSSSASSASSTIPKKTSLLWKELSFTTSIATLLPLTASNQVAAVGGTSNIELYSVEDLLHTYSLSFTALDLVPPTNAWKLPCQMCGGNTFAQVLHGRFLILAPKAAGSGFGSNCNTVKDKNNNAILDKVYCLDTVATPVNDSMYWDEVWTEIATLPDSIASADGLVSLSTYQDSTNVNTMQTASNKLFFFSANGVSNLTNDEYKYSSDKSNNLCLSQAWKWSSSVSQTTNNNNVIPICESSKTTATSLAASGVGFAQTSPTSFYASQVPSGKTANGLVFVNVSSEVGCAEVTQSTSAKGHSVSVMSQPYLLAMQCDSSSNGWHAQVFTVAANGVSQFSTDFPITTSTPVFSFAAPLVTQVFPGFLLAMGSSVESYTCNSGNKPTIYGTFLRDAPRFPAATSIKYNASGLRRWQSLHNKGLSEGDLSLQVGFDLKGTKSFPQQASSSSTPYISPFEFDMWLSADANCLASQSFTSSVKVNFSSIAESKKHDHDHHATNITLALKNTANPPPFPVTCMSSGVCPFGDSDLSGTARCFIDNGNFALSAEQCFTIGCCWSASTASCHFPTTLLSQQQQSSPSIPRNMMVENSENETTTTVPPSTSATPTPPPPPPPFQTFYSAAGPIQGTRGSLLPRLFMNFSQTLSPSHSAWTPSRELTESFLDNSSTVSRTHVSKTRTSTFQDIEPELKTGPTIIYVSVAVGSVALIALIIFCFVKKADMTRWLQKKGYYSADGGEPLIPSEREGGVQDGGDGNSQDDDYGTVGKEDHTVEAVVQIEGADFAILKVAGRGAFGTVFQGKRLSDGALVAIKQVPLFTRNEVEDATKELETLLSVPYHKHILQCLVAGIRHGDAGTAGELPAVDRYAKVRGHPGAHHGTPIASMVLVTPFYKNGDLRGFVNSFKRAGRPVPPLACLSFAAQLCDVLDFLHKHKVVHRDIKPENLLLSDDYKQIVLTDFGLAKLQMLENETLMTKAGSLPYVAPECFHGNYHHTVDNWSVGSLMFAIVTKRVDSDNACVMYLEAQKPDFEQMIRRELSIMPAGYVNVVLGLLRDRPDQRLTLKEARRQLALTIKDLQQNFSSNSMESFHSSRHGSQI